MRKIKRNCARTCVPFFLMVLALLANLCGGARSNRAPDYYDGLRVRFDDEMENFVVAQGDDGKNSHIYQVTVPGEEEKEAVHRLAELKVFLPFSSSGEMIPASINDAFTAVLAVVHFNERKTDNTPLALWNKTQRALIEQCNVKLTTELFDTQFSPVETTRTFTALRHKNTSFANPPATAVVGAYRSAVTLPLAILTGVHGLPHVSHASTASEFDNKEQFPLFGRTVTNSVGEANAALRFFQYVQATHVAVLFVTDSYGSALQKAFQDAATKANIVTESIAFPFDVEEGSPEAKGVVESLKRAQFRHVYAIFFEPHVEVIMNQAAAAGLVGPEYLYVFPGLDVFSLQENLNLTAESPLSQAFHGAGLIQMQGGLSTESIVPESGDETATTVTPKKPTSGFDLFRASWREALIDPQFIEYVRTKLPDALANVSGFDRGADFAGDPGAFRNFLYDAITGFGLAMCQAGESSTFFSGEEIYDEFRNLDFVGASGEVRIVNGTRDFRTISFVTWNPRIRSVDEDGDSLIEFVPSLRFDNDIWREIPGNGFVFTGGTDQAPGSLPDPDMDYNYIGKPGRTTGYILMGITVVSSLVSLIWLVCNLHEHVVDSSQPLFLFMVSIGSLIMAATIVPLSLEETVVDNITGLDKACMAAPWLYIIGANVTLSALLAKTRAVFMAYIEKADFIHVSSLDMVKFFAGIVLLNVAVLLTWTLVSPLEWTRVLGDATDVFNRFKESYGTCDSEHAVAFVVSIAAMNLCLLFIGTWWAYRSRNLLTEYSESRYIGGTLIALLQAWAIGIPILVVVGENPQAEFYVKCGVVFVTSQAIVSLVYLPKILFLRAERFKARQHHTDSFSEDKTEGGRRDEQRQIEVIPESTSLDDHDSTEGTPAEVQVVTGTMEVNPQDPSPSEGIPDTFSVEQDSPDALGASQDFSVQSLPKSVISLGSYGSVRTSRMSRLRLSRATSVPSAVSNSSAGQRGLRVLHHPRSNKNLEATGGKEMSKSQLDLFKESIERQSREEQDNLNRKDASSSLLSLGLDELAEDVEQEDAEDEKLPATKVQEHPS